MGKLKYVSKQEAGIMELFGIKVSGVFLAVYCRKEPMTTKSLQLIKLFSDWTDDSENSNTWLTGLLPVTEDSFPIQHKVDEDQGGISIKLEDNRNDLCEHTW